jgi:hypothetical protein
MCPIILYSLKSVRSKKCPSKLCPSKKCLVEKVSVENMSRYPKLLPRSNLKDKIGDVQFARIFYLIELELCSDHFSSMLFQPVSLSKVQTLWPHGARPHPYYQCFTKLYQFDEIKNLMSLAPTKLF